MNAKTTKESFTKSQNNPCAPRSPTLPSSIPPIRRDTQWLMGQGARAYEYTITDNNTIIISILII